MIDTRLFGQMMKDTGYSFYSGVPCSFLKYLINYAVNECDYVMAANEGDAVAISAGAYLAGKKSVVLMQNSGLTNATSPLTSLNYTFKIPVLGFVSLRGEPGLGDEPQHELMGTITEKMLETMEIEWEYLSNDQNEAFEQLKRADSIISENKSFFFVVKKGTFSEVVLKQSHVKESENKRILKIEKEPRKSSRLSALEIINSKRMDAVLLATTGKTGRELYEIEDHAGNLYMVGSMGTISSLGLGMALNSDKKIIAIDGDGSIIMRLGSLVTNGSYSPKNMLHILLDNNCHDSTGGQFTCSGDISFVKIAASCGYSNSYYAHDIFELENFISEWHEKPELTFIHFRTEKGSKKNLGRPKIKPFEVKERLMNFVKGY